MTTTLEDAEELCRIVARRQAVFALTHNYTGYPMVKQARELVRSGKLGKISKIVAEYPQGWLLAVQGMSIWRLDPKHAGISSSVGDIGVHAFNLAQYLTGLELESIGTSYEGRDIWLATITNSETGAASDKPGFLIEANIHSMEWTGSTAALHLVHKLLS